MTAAPRRPSPLPPIPRYPHQLDADDIWAYLCRLCPLRVQGGWPGVLAHFSVVHTHLPTPTRPSTPKEPQPHLSAVSDVVRPMTPPTPRKRVTRAHTAVQEPLFDLDPGGDRRD